MPFDIAQFRTHLKTANSRYARIVSSSFSRLESRLATIGKTLSQANIAEIQQIWAFLPYESQQKYKTAGDYLKQTLPGLVDAIPVKPKMSFIDFRVATMTIAGDPNYPARFYHRHRLTYQSSNGHLRSLAKVGTRERVTHRTDPTAPPFDPSVTAGILMSFTQGATTNAGAEIGFCDDDHSIPNPAILTQTPLAVGVLIADQIYEYTTDGLTWLPIPNSGYELTKGVRMSGGAFVFYFRKRGVGGDSFHFEVEYPIGPKPVHAGKIGVPSPGFQPIADINTYGRRLR